MHKFHSRAGHAQEPICQGRRRGCTNTYSEMTDFVPKP